MTTHPINTLRLYPGNARRGDIDLIAESLTKLGQYKPIIVNKGTTCPDLADTVLAGNHTVMAAQRLGWDTIKVHWVDVDEDTAKRIVLVDNRSSDKATYDVEELVNLATDLPDYEATGFTQDDIDALLEVLEDTYDTDDDTLGDEGEDTASTPGWAIRVDCDTEQQRNTLKAKLTAEGFTVTDA